MTFMAPLRDTFRSFAVDHGLSVTDALFFASVCAFFFFLPLRTDATATILVMTVFSIAAVRQHGTALPPLAGWAKASLLAFVFFLGIGLLASLLHPATLSRFPRMLLWGCCVFSGVALSRCIPRHGSGYFWALFASLAVSFAVAVLFFGYDASRLWHLGRLKLFAIHPSRLALYCAACLFFLLYRTIVSAGRERFLAFAGSLLVFFMLFSTNTRANLLLLPLGIVCLGAVLPARHMKRLGLAFAVCVMLGGAALWLNGSHAAERLVSAVTNPLADPTFKTRIPIWEVGWESFKESPLIGTGHQSYLALHDAYLAEHGNDMDKRYELYEVNVKQAHNLILGRLVETGILGAAGFLLFYLGAVAAAWRGPAEQRWLLAPLVFYMAMNMFDDGLFRMNDAFILFVAGTALGAAAVPRFPAPRRSSPER